MKTLRAKQASRAAPEKARRKTARPWMDYALRILCCSLLFGSGYLLLSGSTFALRMRNDIPGFVPGLTGPQSIALVLAVILAFAPLLSAKRFLARFTLSSFLFAGIGGYWWTTIPWDELITDSGFPAGTPPGLLDYALVASPAVLTAFYAVVSRPSRLRADLLNRGAEPSEVSRAAAASFLAGAALLVVCSALAFGLWTLMASGAIFDAVAPLPTGVPAIVLAAALLAVAYALLSGRVSLRGGLRRPSSNAERRGVLARIRARKSPS